MKKIIFGYSDPAGANQISAIINSLKNDKGNKKVDFRLLTDNSGYQHKDLLQYLEIVNSDFEEMEKIVLEYKPRIIFTMASLSLYL